MSYYGAAPNMNRYLATREVLQQKVDPLIDFTEYDKWTYDSTYNHTYQPDGTVDMIVVIWRGLGHFGTFGGEASFGGGAAYTVENGTKTIKSSFGRGNGSGVTVQFWDLRSAERNFKNAVHEVGHWLLGGLHPYGSGSDDHLVWGMLTRGDDGICANTYERERVAWINPTPITGDVLNAPLLDYVKYGTAYKYHPSGGATNEHYYFENHQKLSVYDNATQNSNDKGIFVIHQQGIYNQSNNIRVKTSNGQWNWSNPFDVTCFVNQTVPAFKPTAVNRAGRNNLDELLKSGSGSSFLFALINDDGDAECGNWLHGGGLDNSFNLTYNNVFSPYSNPYTHTWNNTQNSFTMEVFNQDSSTLNARFYLTSPYDGKPSKPQFVQAEFDTQNKVSIDWDANLEPDVTTGGGYNVYREIYYGTTFFAEIKVNSTLLTTTSVTDNIVYPTGIPSGVELYVRYKVEAVDDDDKVSLKSVSKSLFLGKTVSGYIYDPQTFDGKFIAVDDLDIINGITATVMAGTEFTFLYGSSFEVSGTLNVTGSSGNEVYFDFVEIDYPNGIRYLSGSSGSIDYAIIKNAYYGIRADYSNPDIKNCEIADCYYGIIYYQNNYVSGDAEVLNNHINNNSQCGIGFSSSTARVRSNVIHDNNWGVYCLTNSSPYLGESETYGNNNIYDNDYGVWAYYNSNPFLGRQACVDHGTRNILDNSIRNVYATNNSTVMAELNWWGQNPPDASKIYATNGSSIDYIPYLTSAPSLKTSNGKSSPEELVFDAKFPPSNSQSGNTQTANAASKLNPEWSLFWKLLYARNLIQIKEYKTAQDICMDLISENPDSSLSYYALDLLWQASRNYDTERFVTFLKLTTSSKAKKEIYATMEMIAAGYEPQNLKSQKYDNLISKYSNYGVVKDILFQKFLYYLIEAYDITTARNIANVIRNQFPGSEVSLEAQNLIGDIPSHKKTGSVVMNETEEVLPIVYELKGNYPNPFNPSTNISYALPFESSVTIEIYDITGKLVRKYELPNNQAGYHNIAWNGKNSNNHDVASGIYIYKFRASSLETNEVFSQSNKMMLIR